MTGGIVQLISYGNLDKLFIENPNITFFKKVYLKPTLFSIECFDIPVELSKNNMTNTHKLQNYGDLLKSLNLKIEIPRVKIDYKNKISDIAFNYLQNDNLKNNIEAVYDNVNKSSVLQEYIYNYALDNYNKNLMGLSEYLNVTVNNKMIIVNNDGNNYHLEHADNLILANYLVDFEQTSDNKTIISTSKNTIDDLTKQLLVDKNVFVTNYGIKKYNQYENIKLHIGNILMGGVNIYPIFFSFNQYFNKYLHKRKNKIYNNIFTFDDSINQLKANLQNNILLLDELKCYNDIISIPLIDIKNYENINSQLVYDLLIDSKFNTSAKTLILMDDNINNFNILKILKITTTKDQTIIKCTIFNNKYDEIFRFKSYLSLQNDCKYMYKIIQYVEKNKTDDGESQYLFTINGKYINNFKVGEPIHLFNKINGKYKLICVFKIIEISLDGLNTNILTQSISVIDTSNKIIFISNDLKIPIKNTQKNTIVYDVVNNYNSYINSSKIFELSNERILNNLKGILSGTIKFNCKYILNLVKNIFNPNNFLMNIIELYYDANTSSFSSNFMDFNIELSNALAVITSYLTNEKTSGRFLYREENDIEYSVLYEQIKVYLLQYSSDYTKITKSYDSEFSSYSTDIKKKYLSTINLLTKNTQKIYPDSTIDMSNLIINDIYNKEYLIVKSPNVLSSNKIATILTDSYKLNEQYDVNLDTQLNGINDAITLKLNNPKQIIIKGNKKVILDETNIYFVKNGIITKLFKNNITQLTLYENSVTWNEYNTVYSFSFKKILTVNLSQKKYIIEKHDDTTNEIYYISEFNNVVKLLLYGCKPTCVFNINKKYFVSGLYRGKCIALGINNVFNNDANNNTISYFSKNVNYSDIKKQHILNKYLFTITNNIITVHNLITMYDTIIDINFIIIDNDHIIKHLNNTNIINVDIIANQNDDTIYNMYILTCIDNTCINYLFKLQLKDSDDLLSHTIKIIEQTPILFDNNVSLIRSQIKFNGQYITIYDNAIITDYNFTFEDINSFTLYNGDFIVVYNINKNMIRIFKFDDLVDVNYNFNLDADILPFNYIKIDCIDQLWYENIIKNMWLSESLYILTDDNKIFKILLDFDNYTHETEKYFTFDKKIISINLYNDIDYVQSEDALYVCNNILNINNNNEKIDISNVSYSYHNEQIIFDRILNTFKIIDNNSRFIYGNYSNDGNKLIFKNTISINIVIPNDDYDIKVLQDEKKTMSFNLYLISLNEDNNKIHKLIFNDSLTNITSKNMNMPNLFMDCIIYDNSFYGVLNNTNLYIIKDIINRIEINTIEEFEFEGMFEGNFKNIYINDDDIFFKVSNSQNDKIVKVELDYDNFTYETKNRYGDFGIQIYNMIQAHRLDFIYLENIKKICMIDNDIIIQNDTRLYYVFDNYIYHIGENAFDGLVKHICNDKRDIFVYTLNDELYLINYDINDNPIKYTFENNPTETVIKLYVINVDNKKIIVMVHRYENLLQEYIQFYLLIDEDKKIRRLDSNIYNAIYDIVYDKTFEKMESENYIENTGYNQLIYSAVDDIAHKKITYDNDSKNILYVVNDDCVDFYFLFFNYDIDSVTVVKNRNQYAKPYYILKSYATTEYIKTPTLNSPKLMCIENNLNQYNLIILGHEKSKINITVNRLALQTLNEYIYEISYINLNYDYPANPSIYDFPKDVKKLINFNTQIITVDNIKINLIYKYTRNSDDMLEDINEILDYKTENNGIKQIISNNNKFYSENAYDFHDFHKDILVYPSNTHIYTTDKINDCYIFNGNTVDTISVVDLTDNEDYINVKYDIKVFLNNNLTNIVDDMIITINGVVNTVEFYDVEFQNTMKNNINVTEYINGDNNVLEELNSKYKYTISNYIATNRIKKFDNTIFVLTNVRKYFSNDYVYNGVIIDGDNSSLITVMYNLNDISIIDSNGYIYVLNNGLTYIAKIINQTLYVYYRNYTDIVWQNNKKKYYVNLNIIEPYNTLFRYNDNYNENINNQTNLFNNNKIYNSNVILLDYLRHIIVELLKGQVNYNNPEIFQKTKEDMYNILSELFIKIVKILVADETIIIDDEERTIYKNILNSQINSQYNHIYIKISNNFDSMISYKSINNYVSKELISKNLYEYEQDILNLFTYIDDDIIKKIKIYSYKINKPEYFLWDAINTKTSDELINYIYVYLKEMIILDDLELINYDEFINKQSLDNCYYLMENIENFEKIHNRLSVRLNLVFWKLIRSSIIKLYDCMLSLQKILHDNLINFGEKFYLINRNFAINVQRYSKIVYLDILPDISVVSYIYKYIDYLFNEYDLNQTLKLNQKTIDMYYNMINNIFNDKNMNSITTQNTINTINSFMTFDIMKTSEFNSKLNDYDGSPFVLNFSNNITNIDIIENTVEDMYDDILNKMKIYENNKNILDVFKTNSNLLLQNYNDYIQNKQSKIIIILANKDANETDICFVYVNLIGDIVPDDYITINYRSFYVLEIMEEENKIKIKIDENFSESDLTDLIGKQVYIGFNQFNSGVKESLYSTFEVTKALCVEIFDNFEQIDNIDYTENLNWKYVEKENKIYNYFSSVTNDVNYNKIITKKMKKKYAIGDISILKKSFDKVYRRSNMFNTIDNIIYKFLQLINPYKYIDNNYYNSLYLNYKLTKSFLPPKMFNELIDINNIDLVIDNPEVFLSQMNAIETHKNSYDMVKMKQILYQVENDIFHIETNNYFIVTTNKYNNNVYPYCNCDELFNLDSIIINSTINDKIKLTDINNVFNKIQNYCGNSELYAKVLDYIINLDDNKSNIAINRLKEIIELDKNNINNKFDLMNEYNNYYYYDCIITNYERNSLFQLKIQQMIIWKILNELYPTNKYIKKYYQRLPRDYTYDYSGNNTDYLTNMQILELNNIVDSCLDYINDVDNIEMIDNFKDDLFTNQWDELITNHFNDYNVINMSNLVIPCNYYYLAYLMIKIIPDSNLSNDKYFYYTTTEFKFDYSTNKNVKAIKYDDECINFLKRQKRTKEFKIEDWIGTINTKVGNKTIEIPKVYLCNHQLLNDILLVKLKEYKIYYNSNLRAYDELTNIDIEIKLINYLLLVLLNQSGNHINSTIEENKFIYPTLYLINGRLVRITDLPNGYFYTKHIDDHEHNYLTIDRIKLVDNGINYFGILQNDIYRFIKCNVDKINAIYDNEHVLSSNTYNLELTRTNTKYEKINIDNVDNLDELILELNGTIDIYDKCYCYCEDYYLFIDRIEHVEDKTILYINKNISRNLDENIMDIKDKLLYIGLYNVVNKIFLDKKLRCIYITYILDNYNDYYKIFDQNKIFIDGYSGKKYEYNSNTIYTIRDFIEKLIVDIHQEYITTNKNFSNFLQFKDFFFYENANDENILLVGSGIKTNLKICGMNLVELNNFNNEIFKEVVQNIEFPKHTVYNPKPLMGNWIKYLGHCLIDYIDMYVEDELIQRITGDYLHINYLLNTSMSKNDKYLENIGYNSGSLTKNTELPEQTIYLYLPWFFDKPGNYLPMISLIHTNVYFKIKLNNIDDLIVTNNNNFKLYSVNGNKLNDEILIKTNYMSDFVYLDDDERLKFAQSRHEYLIEQIQYLSPIYVNKNEIKEKTKIIDLNFKNCVKDIVWYCKTENNIVNKDYLNFSSYSSSYNKILGKLENIDLYRDKLINDKMLNIKKIRGLSKGINISDNLFTNKKLNLSWFAPSEYKYIQNKLLKNPEYTDDGPIKNSIISICNKEILNHPNTYTTKVIPRQKYNSNYSNGLHAYSFALNPLERQQSGTMNFSVSNDVKLKIELDDKILDNSRYLMVNVIGRSYNIFRVFSGYGACVY